MKPLRPTPQEERWLVAASRLGLDRNLPWLAGRSGSWAMVSSRARCVFFALSLVAAIFTAWIFSLLSVPYFMLVAGVLSVALAEWLAAKKHLWQAGIEEGLEVAGLSLIAMHPIMRNGDPHDVYFPAAAMAVLVFTGCRFLNPLFTSIGAIAFSFAAHAVSRLLGLGHGPAADVAGISCLAVGWIALALGALTFARPSHEKILQWLVVAMPVAGYLWILDGFDTHGWRDSLHVPQASRLVAIAMLAAHGIASLIAGLRRRRHAPLVAFMACCACIAYELRDLTGLSLELRLLVAGCALFVVAGILERYLRTARSGITSTDLTAATQSEGLLQLLGASALAPHSSGQSTPAFKGGGGTFSGGGASGDY